MIFVISVGCCCSISVLIQAVCSNWSQWLKLWNQFWVDWMNGQTLEAHSISFSSLALSKLTFLHSAHWQKSMARYAAVCTGCEWPLHPWLASVACAHGHSVELRPFKSLVHYWLKFSIKYINPTEVDQNSWRLLRSLVRSVTRAWCQKIALRAGSAWLSQSSWTFHLARHKTQWTQLMKWVHQTWWMSQWTLYAQSAVRHLMNTIRLYTGSPANTVDPSICSLYHNFSCQCVIDSWSVINCPHIWVTPVWSHVKQNEHQGPECEYSAMPFQSISEHAHERSQTEFIGITAVQYTQFLSCVHW